jgi:DNA-directed RNA polymerase I, II, and III subunit RPABC3
MEKSLTEVHTYHPIFLHLYIYVYTCTVSRINARSENYEMDLTLDFANELYALDINDTFTLVVASSLSRDGHVRDDKESWRNVEERTLADDYDYVMYGKVYKYEESGQSKVYVDDE